MIATAGRMTLGAGIGIGSALVVNRLFEHAAAPRVPSQGKVGLDEITRPAALVAATGGMIAGAVAVMSGVDNLVTEHSKLGRLTPGSRAFAAGLAGCVLGVAGLMFVGDALKQ